MTEFDIFDRISPGWITIKDFDQSAQQNASLDLD